MNLDFLEIGTSNFRTIIETADNDVIGISVEPLSYYLDQLPNPKNVIKENVAIAFDDTEKYIEIYYIPENMIEEQKLPDWLKGCNSLTNYHPKHIELGVTNLVKIERVLQIPIDKLLEKYNVKTIEFLKIDTEGGDCDILLNLKNYLISKDKSFYPRTIQFETNFLTPNDKLEKVIEEYYQLGYIKGKKKKTDTILILD